jgi:hypothetical protein
MIGISSITAKRTIPDAQKRPVIHGPEVRQQMLARRTLEGSGVPDNVVERGVPDAGEFGLVVERHRDAPVERGAVRTEVLRRDTMPTLRETRIIVVEGKRH